MRVPVGYDFWEGRECESASRTEMQLVSLLLWEDS